MGRFAHIDEQAKSERWIERLRLNDEAALRTMVMTCYTPVAGFAYRYTRSHELAEEVAQDVFIRLWDRRSALSISGSFIAYLFTAARNIAVNYLDRTSERVSFVAHTEAANNIHSVIGTGDLDLDRRELSRSIRVVLDALAPRAREVFLLSRRDGLTPAQIAEVLGLNVQTVYTLLGRALRELQRVVAS